MAALVALAVLAALANPSAAQSDDNPLIGMDEAEMLSHLGFSGDQLGYVVFDPDSGAVLAERNADGRFIPASTVKVLTAVMALEVLGGDYRFATGLYVDGVVGNGRVSGDLYLRGGGDPFLLSDDLADLADTLADRDLTAIDGRFYYDDTRLIEVPQINDRQPQSVAYNSGVGALSLNFNRIRVDWQGNGGGFRGEALAVTDTLTVPLTAITVGAAPAGTPAHRPFQRGAGGGERWLISQALPSPGEDWLPVGSPGPFAADVFRQLSGERGLALPAPQPGEAPLDARELALHQSAPLSIITREVLRYSNNMAAELIGLTATREITGAPLDLGQSAMAMAAWLGDRVPGLAAAGLVVDNHSGLSSAARVTPNQMRAVLGYAANRPLGGVDLWSILHPVRWLEAVHDRAPVGAAPIEIRAKSGTMSYGRGLVGYIDAASGERIGFAVFVSDIAARQALDARFDPYQHYSGAEARDWLQDARALEQELVTRWALAY